MGAFLTAVEAKYERKPGMIGKIQGLKNDPSPARKAILRFTIVTELIFPPTLVPTLSEVSNVVKN